MRYKRSHDLQERMDYYTKNHNSIKEGLEEEQVLDTPEPGPQVGMADLLISAINDEWDTISSYNGAIAMAIAEGFDDMVPVIQDIVNEENTHVGQLQKLLQTISPNAEEISKGEMEAEEQLSNPVETE